MFFPSCFGCWTSRIEATARAGRQAVCPGLEEMVSCLKRCGVEEYSALKNCQTRHQLACRESTAQSSTAESRRNDASCVIFCALHRSCFVHAGPFISVWDFVKSFNHDSRAMNEIRIIKVWFVPALAGYKQLFHEFDPWNDNINA